MKKFLSTAACLMLSLLLAGCSETGGAPKEKVFIEKDQISDLYTSPKDFKGKYVELTGRVFTNPETQDDMVFLQMWQDPKNSDHNTIIVASKEIAGDIENDDYIKLTGYIEDEFKGENMMGGEITAPQIVAEKIEKSSYKDVVSPTNKTIDVNKTIEKNGVKVTLSKVELADTETRVYLSIDNQSGFTYSFYSFDSTIIQNKRQFKEESNFEADYDEIESDISSGVKEDGIICFKAIENSNFKFICEGQSENYELDSDTFTFEINFK